MFCPQDLEVPGGKVPPDGVLLGLDNESLQLL